jgi:hypothetical protein
VRKFKLIVGESLRAASPVRLALVDDFTGRPPFGALNPVLEQVVGGKREPVAVRPRFGDSGTLIYPNLGLLARPVPGPLTFRLTLTPDYYVPYYRRHLDALVFEVKPFNHETPPPGEVRAAVLKGDPDDPASPATPEDARVLLPSIRYPFGSDVTVLYGRVIRKRQPGEKPEDARPGPNIRVKGRPDGGGPAAAILGAAADVHIRDGVQQVALTDDDGWFALPLRTTFPELLLDISTEWPNSSRHPSFPAFQHRVKWANKTTYLAKPADWIELPV